MLTIDRNAAFLIVPACPDDLARLQELEADSFSSDFLSHRQMRYHLQNPRAVFLTVRDSEGAVSGYALALRAQNRPARLYSIAVDRKRRGHGLGKLLCRAVMDALRKNGESRLLLEVDANDRNTVGFYEKMGFQTTKRLPAYYEDGRDAYKMQVLL